MEKYIKVYVTDESSLPKEDDFYPVQRKDSIVEWEIWEPSKDKGYIDKWLNEIDWYLLPQSEEEQKEELRKELVKFGNWVNDNLWKGTSIDEGIVNEYLSSGNFGENLNTEKRVITTTDYPDQFTGLPTDEEIKDEAIKYSSYLDFSDDKGLSEKGKQRVTSWCKDDFTSGARWARDYGQKDKK